MIQEKIIRPCLYTIATPIGNIADLSPRAQYYIENMDILAVEDSRVFKKLCTNLGLNVNGKIVSHHKFSERSTLENIISYLMEDSKCVGLLSDAGTPNLSDPGSMLLHECQTRNIRVSPIPGASALTAIISVSGGPIDHFEFLGFLPKKNTARQNLLSNAMASHAKSIIFYESPHRIIATLKEIMQIDKACHLTIGRELTKQFEEIFYATIADSLEKLESKAVVKGEFAVIIHKRPKNEDEKIELSEIEQRITTLLEQGCSTKKICMELKDYGYTKNEIYEITLGIKKREN